MTDRVCIVVMISGSGSNLQAIIDAIANNKLNAKIEAVISDQADAFGLQRANAAAIKTEVIESGKYSNREDYDKQLATTIATFKPDLVVLAGFMRILSPAFVKSFESRLLNIHPSLLPAYRGLHTHRRALAAGDQLHGCSIHFVTDILDGGPLVAQALVPILPDDTVQSLSARVQQREHKLYPIVISWFADGRLKLNAGKLMLDNNVLTAPVRYGIDEDIE